MQTYTVFFAKNPMMMLNMDAPTVAFKENYVEVTKLDAADLEVVFDTMNCYREDISDMPLQLGVRSMSVGDIAVTKDEAWYVCGTGWKKVTFA